MKMFIGVVLLVMFLSGIVFSAVRGNAASVVTVQSLVANQTSHKQIRLGARVTDDEFIYRTEPDFFLQFWVTDPASAGSQKVQVDYQGIMPNTLQVGRDVIVEGDFINGKVVARTLLTQCPSKYEPPQT